MIEKGSYFIKQSLERDEDKAYYLIIEEDIYTSDDLIRAINNDKIYLKEIDYLRDKDTIFYVKYLEDMKGIWGEYVKRLIKEIGCSMKIIHDAIWRQSK